MSKPITDFIKEELYPSLFNYIDIAFPEMNFNRFSKGWRSSLGRYGRQPKNDSPGKSTILFKSPGYIKEWGEVGLTLVDYVMTRDSLELIPAVEKLATICNLKLPTLDNMEEYKAHKRKEDARESLRDYFKYLLLESKDGGKDRDEVYKYLTEDRGYSREDIDAMELGYKPNQERIEKRLKDLGYTPEEIKEAVGNIPDTNKLAIPIYTTGKLIGFSFRATSPEAKAKYYNTPGLERGKTLIGLSALRDTSDLVIVEGYLDALISQTKGLKNVVALGSASLNRDQVKEAVRVGAKSFTLCLDNDATGVKNTATAINNILAEGVNRVYIVNSIEGYKDVDELIKAEGVEPFKKAIQEAIPYYEYKLTSIIEHYRKLEETQGELYPRDIDSLQEEVITTGAKITNPLDKDKFKKSFINFEPIKALGITEESLSITLDNLTSSKEKEEQTRELNKLLAKVKTLQEQGGTTEALELLEGKVKEVKLRDKATEFSSLLLPNTEAEVITRQANKPESLETSYRIDTETVLLPSGAISVLCAPTSHGKTTLLLNLAIDVTKKNPDKSFYIFSYEEDRDAVTTSALNIYQGEELSKNNRKSISGYFSTGGSTEYFKQGEPGLIERFKAKKETFFKELIETNRLNIQYSDYNSSTLCDAIRYLAKNTNIGGVFIDYFQLLTLPQGKYKTLSRQEELKQICIELKDVAVETGLPIILGAQFNREVVNQMRVHATKIGEAGDIERIANLIVGFWNNNFPMLGNEGEISEINNKGMYKPGTIYATILKQRGGVVGVFDTWEFNGNTGNISNQSNAGNNYFK